MKGTIGGTLSAVSLVALLTSGCAAMSVSDNAHRGSPKFYGGTKLDVAALRNDEATLDEFGRYGIHPPANPALDLPLSFALDTVLLPFATWYAVTEPLVGRE